MDVLILTVFISLVLVAAAVLFLVKRTREGDFEHGDRLSLLPLDDEPPRDPKTGTGDDAEPGPARRPPAATPPDAEPNRSRTRPDPS